MSALGTIMATVALTAGGVSAVRVLRRRAKNAAERLKRKKTDAPTIELQDDGTGVWSLEGERRTERS